MKQIEKCGDDWGSIWPQVDEPQDEATRCDADKASAFRGGVKLFTPVQWTSAQVYLEKISFHNQFSSSSPAALTHEQ